MNEAHGDLISNASKKSDLESEDSSRIRHLDFAKSLTKPQKMLLANSSDEEESDDSGSDGSEGSDDLTSKRLRAFPSDLLEKFGIGSAQLSSLGKEDAARLVDALHSHLTNYPADSTDRANAMKLLQDLCLISGRPPSSFELHDVIFDREVVVGQGGEATVYRGQMRNQPVVVREVVRSLKEWRSSAGRKIIQLLHREAITHSGLHHPNILPFLGIFYEADRSHPMVVLPLLEMGSLRELMASSKDAILSRYLPRIIMGIGRGVAYLHSQNPPIIHGDLHPGNILLGPFGQTLLCDFGLSRVRYEVTRTNTMIQEGGSMRFMAPELSGGISKKFRTSQPSDIFALSMTLLSIWTRQPPFHDVQNERMVASMLRKGERPNRPARPLGLPSSVEGAYWTLVVSMWAQEARDRPPSEGVQEDLERLCGWSAGEQAVMLEQEPSEADPASHRPMLASDLNNLGNSHYEAGRYDEAVASCQKAVTLQQELLEAKREPHCVPLASYLNSLGRSLHQARRYSEACSPYQEAVTLLREPFEADPTYHRPTIASYLNNLGNSLYEAGRYDEAFSSFQEAVTLQQELLEAKRGPHCVTLASYLNNLARSLHQARRYSEACTHYQEAVTLQRELFEAEGRLCAAKLAEYLNNLGHSLHQAERYGEACVPYNEAIALNRELCEAEGGPHRGNLALCLHNLGCSLHQAKRYSEVCPLYQEAATLQQELFEAGRGPHRAKLAEYFNNLGHSLHLAGRYKQACAPHQKAVTIQRQLFEAERGPHRAMLAIYLNNHGYSLQLTGRYRDASTHHREAVTLQRELFEAERGPHRAGLALYLHNLGRSLHQAKCYDEAYAPYQEAVALQRELFDTDPATYGAGLTRYISELEIVEGAVRMEVRSVRTGGSENN